MVRPICALNTGPGARQNAKIVRGPSARPARRAPFFTLKPFDFVRRARVVDAQPGYGCAFRFVQSIVSNSSPGSSSSLGSVGGDPSGARTIASPSARALSPIAVASSARALSAVAIASSAHALAAVAVASSAHALSAHALSAIAVSYTPEQLTNAPNVDI